MAAIACGADGECPVCAEELINALMAKFPGRAAVFSTTYADLFG